MDDAVWAPTPFTKNRDRLLEGDLARAFFEDVVEQARGRRLLSAEHFTVDGTLLEAWAGQKSFKRKDQRREPPGRPHHLRALVLPRGWCRHCWLIVNGQRRHMSTAHGDADIERPYRISPQRHAGKLPATR
jgi:hypothetical protein